MNPCSNRYSDLWNPSGSVSPTVFEITLGPAKQINAFGSANVIDPHDPKAADTPPLVGFVLTTI